MIVRKQTGYIIHERHAFHKLYSGYSPIVTESVQWKLWRTVIRPFTCAYCLRMNGRILSLDASLALQADLPVHDNCSCTIKYLQAIRAGTAANAGMDGVD